MTLSFFHVLARSVRKGWWIWIVLWLALGSYLYFGVPKLSVLAERCEPQFLPSWSDSVRAQGLLNQAFPGDSYQTRIVLVASSARPFQAAERSYLEQLSSWLSDSNVFPKIRKVTSPSAAAYLRSKLVNRDETACLIVVNLDTSYIDVQTQHIVNQILDHVRKAPPSLTIQLSGDATLARDYHQEIGRSLRSTTRITLLLVLTILLLVYRSPVAPLVSLVTIFISFVTSRGLLALAVLNGLKVSSLTEIFLVVVLYGIGTDYCLFLVSRYREELIRCATTAEALEKTLKNVGEAIACSAGTVIGGLGLMSFAQFGPFHRTGPCVAMGVLIALLASLTLAPSLIMLLRPILFWPTRVRADRLVHPFWTAVARLVNQRPMRILMVVSVLSLPILYFGSHIKRSFDLFGELPASAEAVKGQKRIQTYFPIGVSAPVSVAMEIRGCWTDPDKLNALYRMTREIATMKDVAEVRSAVQPLGELGEMQKLVFSYQLPLLEEGVGKAMDGLSRMREGTNEAQRRLDQYSQELTASSEQKFLFFSSPAAGRYRQAAQGLEKMKQAVCTMQDGLNEMEKGLGTLRSRVQALSDPQNKLLGLFDVFVLTPDLLKDHPELKEAMDHYISQDGTVTKMEIMLEHQGFSYEAMQSFQKIQGRLRELGQQLNLPEFQFHLAGATATINDERIVTRSDFRRVVILVIVAVFVILVLLLRRLIAPIYLILTMVFSYFLTLGLTVLAFQYLGRQPALDWKVPFFMFVLLLALGEDYNIFLMSRIKEESRSRGLSESVLESVQKTGSVITSCGFILAGTFAALMASSLLAMIEIGFAIAVGVLLDTFVIRLFVVPSLVLVEERIRRRFS